jgi:hypothetical protein
VPELPRDGEYKFYATIDNPDENDIDAIGWSVIPEDAGTIGSMIDENNKEYGLLRIAKDADLGDIAVRADLYLKSIEGISLAYDETTVTVMEAPTRIKVQPPNITVQKGTGTMGSYFNVDELEPDGGVSKTVNWMFPEGEEFVNPITKPDDEKNEYLVLIKPDTEGGNKIVVRAEVIGIPEEYKGKNPNMENIWWSEGELYIGASVDGSFTISFDDLNDNQPEVDGGSISVLEENGLPLIVDKEKDGIDDIKWIYDGQIVLEGIYNLDFNKRYHQNRIGDHKVTVEVLIGGAWYSKTVNITVTY